MVSATFSNNFHNAVGFKRRVEECAMHTYENIRNCRSDTFYSNQVNYSTPIRVYINIIIKPLQHYLSVDEQVQHGRMMELNVKK